MERQVNKQISIQRIFSQGDYQNLTVTDTITEIPDSIASNPEALKLLRYLQLVDVEWSYIKYMKLRMSEPKLASAEAVEQALSFIEQERVTTFENLLAAIHSENE